MGDKRKALQLAHDLTEPLLKLGDRRAIETLRQLKIYLAPPPEVNDHAGVVDDYRREAVDNLTALGFRVMNRDSDARLDDDDLRDLALRAENAAKQIYRYLAVKARSGDDSRDILAEATARG